DDIFPENVNSMYLVRDLVDSNWYIFLTAGLVPATSSLARIDFGTSLANTPNIVNFDNLEGKMDYPMGVFVAKEADKWYGFYLNRTTNQIMRFDMDTNISLTPTITEVIPSDPTMISGPTDIGALLDDGKWYFFMTNGNDG